MSEKDKAGCIGAGLGLVVIAIVLLIAFGPQGCERRVQAWKSAAYGADWLVIQYTAMGEPMNSWELKNKSIGNEENSDGIFFLDNDGNVIHLSGSYMYVQIQEGKWDAAKKLYLKAGPKGER